jgi:hypothetical protein
VAAHWDSFLRRYLEITLRLCAYAAALYFLGALDGLLAPFVTSGLIRAIAVLVVCMIEFEIIERVVEKNYTPLFAGKGIRKALREHAGNTTTLDLDDYEYRTKSEKLVISLVLYFLINFALSMLGPGSGAIHLNWKTSYPVMGFMGIAAGVNLFLGVAIWSALSPKRSRSGRWMIVFTGLVFQLPAIAYALFTLFYFFLWNEKFPSA